MSIPLPALAVVLITLSFAFTFCAFVANENRRSPQARNWAILASMAWLAALCCAAQITVIATVLGWFATCALVAGLLARKKRQTRGGIRFLQEAMKK